MRQNEEHPTTLDFESALAQVAQTLRRSLSATPPVIRGLTRHLARTPGKNLRAAAVLATAMRPGGAVPAEAVQAAAAVELLHLATLVHDDIIDRSPTRRGAQTLHTLFGEKAAVLGGDYLLCLALQQAAALPPREERRPLVDKSLAQSLSNICLGELRQNQNIRNYALTKREYFRIIREKTASLFELSFYAGYLLSDDAEEHKDSYRELGRTVGVMFQLADDCNDFRSSPKASKKPVMSDYEQGVVTLPLIYALQADETLREKLENGLGEAALKQAVSAAGGLDATLAEIRKYHKKAHRLLAGLGLETAKAGLLAGLIDRASGL